MMTSNKLIAAAQSSTPSFRGHGAHADFLLPTQTLMGVGGAVGGESSLMNANRHGSMLLSKPMPRSPALDGLVVSNTLEGARPSHDMGSRCVCVCVCVCV